VCITKGLSRSSYYVLHSFLSNPPQAPSSCSSVYTSTVRAYIHAISSRLQALCPIGNRFQIRGSRQIATSSCRNSQSFPHFPAFFSCKVFVALSRPKFRGARFSDYSRFVFTKRERFDKFSTVVPSFFPLALFGACRYYAPFSSFSL